jgi:hypothetical protein
MGLMMHWPAEQISPGLQQPQPHAGWSMSHWTGTHVPLLQISPQPQSGLHGLDAQRPAMHCAPPLQPQVFPQPSLPPQVPSVGQDGVQHAFM